MVVDFRVHFVVVNFCLQQWKNYSTQTVFAKVMLKWKGPVFWLTVYTVLHAITCRLFLSILPSRYHYHPAFPIHSIFLLGHSLAFTSSVSSQDHKPILSTAPRLWNGLLPSLCVAYPSVSYITQLYIIILWSRTGCSHVSWGLLFSSQNLPLRQEFFSIAFSLSDGLLPSGVWSSSAF